jgi:hypothetical protein
MKKVYGICSGECFDWHIDYMFESEDIRDKVLEKLNDSYYEYDNYNYNDYSPIDYELNDNKFNLNKAQDIKYVRCKYNSSEDFKFEILDGNTLINNINSFNNINLYKTYIDNEYKYTLKMTRVIKKDDLKDMDELKNKFLKICSDYYSQGIYMVKVLDMNIWDVNSKLKSSQ